jgi:very-short-patch-repair endonuclease
MTHLHNTYELKQKRRNLRKCGTAAEAVLWKYLKRRQLSGKKFRRQFSIGPYIVDFYCPECRLIVELDGQPHLRRSQAQYDERRTEYFMKLRMTVIRFENRELYLSVEAVLERIKSFLTTPSAP